MIDNINPQATYYTYFAFNWRNECAWGRILAKNLIR